MRAQSDICGVMEMKMNTQSKTLPKSHGVVVVDALFLGFGGGWIAAVIMYALFTGDWRLAIVLITIIMPITIPAVQRSANIWKTIKGTD